MPEGAISFIIKTMGKSKITTVVLSIAIALFVLSVAIAVPILYRGLYYSQIEKLDLVSRTGYSEEVIRDAFDEMMDYCTGGGADSGLTFGTGELAWSESGKAHFDDVQKLFSLDFLILEVTAVVIFAYMAAKFMTGGDDRFGEVSTVTGHLSNTAPGSPGAARTAYLHPYRFMGRGPLFWGPAIMMVVFGIIGAVAAVNFDAFFVKFHHMFFPGKDNWIFDPSEDEIIKILPEEVFMNFALLILVILIIGCACCIAADFIIGGRSKKTVK